MRSIGVIIGLVALALPAAATPNKTVAYEPEPPAERPFELGVSLYGLVMGSFLDEPQTKDKVITLDDGRRAQVLYPGFAGVGGGAGLSLVGMWRGIVGLELGVYNSVDHGTGEINNVEFTIGQSAWHIPLMLRVAVPAESVRPFLSLGIDFVLPGEAEVTDVELPALADRLGAEADSYVAWTMGFGFEFRLPTEQDLRIPLAFRWNYHSVGDTAEDRLGPFDCGTADLDFCANPKQQVFKTEWQHQVVASLGFGWYFQ